MLYSERDGYCFVHIYKVAGQSVKLALREHELRPIPLIRKPLARLVELPIAYTFRPLDAHATALAARQWLGRDEWDRIFTFSFVRNPWDWQVSLYHFIQTNKLNHQRDLVRSMRFDEYIRWRVAEDLHLQSAFVTDAQGNDIVDFVGRFERLDADFAHVCDTIGLDLRLPHENATDHDTFRRYYDDDTAALVAEHFAADIERFGYTFDD